MMIMMMTIMIAAIDFLPNEVNFFGLVLEKMSQKDATYALHAQAPIWTQVQHNLCIGIPSPTPTPSLCKHS